VFSDFKQILIYFQGKLKAQH